MTGSQTEARLHWWGTLLYVPLLYGAGWLLSRPLALMAPSWRADQVNLAGAALALLLLLLTLPLRLRQVWDEFHPWQRLGLLPSGQGSSPGKSATAILLALLRGLLKAVILLVALTVPLILLGHARWRGDLSSGELWNALALVLGVGFAEELVFRGWLMGELELLAGPRRALSLQARIFALVHPWYRFFDHADLPHGLAVLALIIGMILLGTVLGLQRKVDGGLLWGAIGLHGGLVGGWFALEKGLLEISPDAPSWLIGPGAGSANPIGGVVGIASLALLMAIRKRKLARNRGDEAITAP
jgi:membrane protease YdiL (CAAX protease family)